MGILRDVVLGSHVAKTRAKSDTQIIELKKKLQKKVKLGKHQKQPGRTKSQKIDLVWGSQLSPSKMYDHKVVGC